MPRQPTSPPWNEVFSDRAYSADVSRKTLTNPASSALDDVERHIGPQHPADTNYILSGENAAETLTTHMAHT